MGVRIGLATVGAYTATSGGAVVVSYLWTIAGTHAQAATIAVLLAVPLQAFLVVWAFVARSVERATALVAVLSFGNLPLALL